MRRRVLIPIAALALAALSAMAQQDVDAGDDFVAGKKILVETNLARDPLGSFPRIFRLHGGNMEVANVGGKRFLRATSSGEFAIPLPEVLPQRFTMEFELAGSGGWYQEILFAEDEEPFFISLRPQEDGGLAGPNDFRAMSEHGLPVAEGAPVQVRVMADGSYVKVYMNGRRVANAPNARIGRSKAIRFKLMADSDTPALVGNLRIAAGGKDLYRALNEEGRFTAEGILFDTASDRIRPESETVLQEIGALLAAHGELKIGIEGHTDNAGSDSANQALSEKRAAAVRTWLVQKGKVAAERLEAKGYGSTQPAASNETPEGKQTNRRVELVRL